MVEPKSDLLYSNPFPNYPNYYNPYQYASGYTKGLSYGYTPAHASVSAERDLGLGVKKFGGGSGWDTMPYGWDLEKKKNKKSAALSALTLIAFLFFLNLLQSCLKEQMYAMNPTLMVMTASAAKQDPFASEVQRSSENNVKFGTNEVKTSTFPAFEAIPKKRRKVKRTRGKKRPYLKKEGRVEVGNDNKGTIVDPTIATKLMNLEMVN